MKTNKLTIEIDEFDHAAMVDDPSGEVARILTNLVKQISEYGIPNADGFRLKDTNGNSVGTVNVNWDEDEDEPDTSDICTIRGSYGGDRTPCDVLYCSRTLWYAVEGSSNVNQAPYGYEFEEGVWVEEIPDVDTMTVSGKILSEEDLARAINE